MSFSAGLEPGAEDRCTNPDPSDEAFDPDHPPGDRLQCVVEDGQLLIGIPAGSNELVRWLGLFTAVLFAVLWALTYYLVRPDDLDITLVVILAFGWVGFLSAVGHWIRARFRTVILLIDTDRVVQKSKLFGLFWHKEYSLASFSKAKLVIAHKRNDEPIYAVSIATLGDRPQFGAFLRQEEKEWLTRRINHHLGRDDGSAFGQYMDPNPTGEQWSLKGELKFFDE